MKLNAQGSGAGDGPSFSAARPHVDNPWETRGEAEEKAPSSVERKSAQLSMGRTQGLSTMSC